MKSKFPDGEKISTAEFISKCSLWCLDYFVDEFNKTLRELKAQGTPKISIEDLMQHLHIAHQNYRVILEETVEKAAKISLSSKKIKET